MKKQKSSFVELFTKKVKNYLSNDFIILDVNSSTGYPDRRYPITEDEYWDDEPYISYYGYGWSRRYREKMMEHLCFIKNILIMLRV